MTIKKDATAGTYGICNGCRMPISAKEMKSSKYKIGLSCPKCYDKLSNDQIKRFTMRHNQIVNSKIKFKFREKNKMNILTDDIKKLIRKLAIPAVVGTLFQTLYNVVDTFFAGKISPEALSALSKSFPVYFIIIATSIGVTVAGTSLIGNSIGEKNEKNSLFFIFHILYILRLIISIIITFLGLNYSEKIFILMGSSEYVTSLGLQYTDIIFYGSILFILVVAINSLLHAEGDTKTYRNVLILSFLINIILNPILIFGFMFIPAFGIKGIGISTLVAQFVSFTIILFKVLKNSRVKKNYERIFIT